MRDNELALYEIVKIRILKNNEGEIVKFEGVAKCNCCFRDLSERELREVIDRLLEEKECDIEYLKNQLSELDKEKEEK